MIRIAAHVNYIMFVKFHYDRAGSRLRLRFLRDPSCTHFVTAFPDVHGAISSGGCDSVNRKYVHTVCWSHEHPWNGSQVGISRIACFCRGGGGCQRQDDMVVLETCLYSDTLPGANTEVSGPGRLPALYGEMANVKATVRQFWSGPISGPVYTKHQHQSQHCDEINKSVTQESVTTPFWSNSICFHCFQ